MFLKQQQKCAHKGAHYFGLLQLQKIIANFNSYLDTNGSFATEIPLLLPDDVIMDSARAFMTLTGNDGRV